MKKSIVLILAVISLTACQGNLGKQEVTIEDRYSITIPSFLTKA